MNTSLPIEEKEMSSNLFTRFICNFISLVFHPIFIPIYVTAFLAHIHPNAFVGFSEENKNKTIIIVGLNVSVFPLLCVLLLKGVGFIDSIMLRTQKDRIIPYIASGIFFFWAYTVFKQQLAYPRLLPAFLLGLFLSSSGALLVNIYQKISMHAIGMGTALGFFIMLMLNNSMMMSGTLFTTFLLTGIVCTARLLLRSHTTMDIYLGIFLGIISEAAGYYFVM